MINQGSSPLFSGRLYQTFIHSFIRSKPNQAKPTNRSFIQGPFLLQGKNYRGKRVALIPQYHLRGYIEICQIKLRCYPRRRVPGLAEKTDRLAASPFEANHAFLSCPVFTALPSSFLTSFFVVSF
jgi:hypothetical protein